MPLLSCILSKVKPFMGVTLISAEEVKLTARLESDIK